MALPLIKSAAPSAVGTNITRERAVGKSPAQSLAIALSTQDRARHHMAGGGLSLAALPKPVGQQGEDSFHNKGLFNSDVAGRTDRLPHTVPADSFVLPADVVSGIGSGNTLAGAKIMDGILHSGPYGTKLPHAKRADGGSTPKGGTSSVIVAGGEYLINPEDLKRIGARRRAAKVSRARSDLAAGHEWAREFVETSRKHQKRFLKTAPKPKA